MAFDRLSEKALHMNDADVRLVRLRMRNGSDGGGRGHRFAPERRRFHQGKIGIVFSGVDETERVHFSPCVVGLM